MNTVTEKELTAIERTAMKLVIRACDHSSLLMVATRYAGRYSDLRGINHRALVERMNHVVKEYTGNEAHSRILESHVVNALKVSDLIPIVVSRIEAFQTVLRYLHPIQALDIHKAITGLITTTNIQRFVIEVPNQAGDLLLVRWSVSTNTARPEVCIGNVSSVKGVFDEDRRPAESYATLKDFGAAYGIF